MRLGGEQDLDRAAAHGLVGQGDGGEPGAEVGGELVVVERDDRDVVGDGASRLEDRLVGAEGEWPLFWRIHVPLSTPAISSLAILLFLWTWNQFLLAVVLVSDPTQRTMAGALGAFQGQWGTDIPLLCAGSLLILTPTLIVFLVFQRQFASALLQGSLKG